jgi:hypothetical protein
MLEQTRSFSLIHIMLRGAETKHGLQIMELVILHIHKLSPMSKGEKRKAHRNIHLDSLKPQAFSPEVQSLSSRPPL